MDSNPFYFDEINVKGKNIPMVVEKESTKPKISPKRAIQSKKRSPNKSNKYQQLMQGKIRNLSVSHNSKANSSSEGKEITVRDQGIGASSQLSKRSGDPSPLNSADKLKLLDAQN